MTPAEILRADPAKVAETVLQRLADGRQIGDYEAGVLARALLMARECFLNMLADASQWEVDVDGDEVDGRPVVYVTHFIEVDGFTFDQLPEVLGIKPAYMETMEDAIRRAIGEPAIALAEEEDAP